MNCDGLYGGRKHEEACSLFLFCYLSCQSKILLREYFAFINEV